MRKLSFLLLLIVSTTALSQDRFAKVEIIPQHLAGSVHMLKGAGGNIGVSAGEDGILIIDDQFAPLADKISAALKAINPAPVKYVINTHYHGDHTGGNLWLKEIHDATIFAHDNVRHRLMSKEGHEHKALPVVTYSQGIKFHFNDETVNVVHLSSGHTDGDSAVFFETANVLHTGDLFFRDRFPYVDLKAGGTVEGYMASVQVMLNMIGDDTQIIPGHGPLAGKKDLQDFLDMMRATSAVVAKMKASGLSVEQAVEKGLDNKWASWGKGWITEERWITTLYQ